MTVVSVAYRLADGIYYHAYPFWVGGAEAKGFAVQTHKTGRDRGKPKGDPDGRWDWDGPDVNLGRQDWFELRKWLVATGERCGHVYQNAKFDLHILADGSPHGWPGVYLEPYVKWDTMLASAELWPTQSTGLKPTAARIWGDEAVEEAAELKEALVAVKLRYGLRAADGPRFDLVPWPVLGPYAGSDAALTLQLAEYQQTQFDEWYGSTWQFGREMELMRVLYRVERRGFGPYDVEFSRQVAEAIERRLEVLAPALDELFGGAPTPANARRYFFDRMGAEPWGPGDVRTGSVDRNGKPRPASCGAHIARRMAADGVPGAAEYAEYLDLSMANRMFYRNYSGLAGSDRRLRAGYRQAHVRSGRMSVERFQALRVDEPVLTPAGWRPIGDLRVGDAVIGGDGMPTKIRSIPFDGEAESWEVRTSDGEVIVCDPGHLWAVRLETPSRARSVVRVMRADEIAAYQRRVRRSAVYTPARPAVEFDPVHLPVDPYTLGVLLGDGHLGDGRTGGGGTVHWTSHRGDAPEIAEYVRAAVPDEVRVRREIGNCVTHSIIGGGRPSSVMVFIRECGLRGARAFDKFVPEAYLRGSVEERYALLRGLMDTDGAATGRWNLARFFTSSVALRDGVVELVRSLGGQATWTERVSGAENRTRPAFVVAVRTPENPFRLRRKADRWTRPVRDSQSIVVVPGSGRAPMRCIEVENEDGLFITRGYTVTHNCQAMPKHLGLTLHGKPLPEPRELFGVGEGLVRVNLDLTQAELRIAARMSDCTAMVEALETGADLHGQTTVRVFRATPGDPDWAIKRDIAKRLTFGSIFGIGAPTFQKTLYQLAGVIWPLADCQEAVSAWRRAYPEFQEAYRYWEQVAVAHGRVELYDGSYSWMAGDYPNTAWNRRVQGPQTVDTPIHTTSRGWVRAGDIRPGDILHGRRGPTAVEAVQDAGVNRVHRVYGHDGRYVDVAGHHRWLAYRVRNDWRDGNPSRELSTVELAAQVGRRGGYDRLPLMVAYDGPGVDLPVDPYLLGAWLGDGDRTQTNCDVTIFSNRDDYGHLILAIGEPRRIKFGAGRKVSVTWNWAGRGSGYPRGPEVTAEVMRDVWGRGMAEYDGASAAQRLALLRGLMDTDGCSFAARPALAQFTNTDERKAELVIRLARSLGGLARITKHSHDGGTDFHKVRLSMPAGCNPFSIPRKAGNWRPGARRWLKVDAVEELPVELPMVCFQVGAEDGLYAAGEGYMVTHNSLARWVNHEWLPYIESRTREHEALVMTVHDSAVLDLPVEVADEVVSDIRAWTSESWAKAFGISGGCDRSEWIK